MRWMLGGDVNQGVEPVRRLLDAPHSFGMDPMAAFWSTGWSANARTSLVRYPQADHRVLSVVTAQTTVAVVNMTWQWGGDQQLLNAVAKWADVMLLVECRTRDDKPLPVRSFIGDTHRVRQNLTDSAHAGSVIAVRRAAGYTLESSRLSLLSPAGHNVQERFIRSAVVTANGRTTMYGAAHLALPSTGVQDDGERALRAWVARARRA